MRDNVVLLWCLFWCVKVCVAYQDAGGAASSQASHVWDLSLRVIDYQVAHGRVAANIYTFTLTPDGLNLLSFRSEFLRSDYKLLPSSLAHRVFMTV